MLITTTDDMITSNRKLVIQLWMCLGQLSHLLQVKPPTLAVVYVACCSKEIQHLSN